MSEKLKHNTLQIQFLWTWPLAMWGLSAGEARFYGWRMWLRIGPAHVLIGRGKTMTRLIDLPEMIVRDVAELPDRTSPEDQPDMMLVTAAELDRIVEDRIAEVGPLCAAAPELLYAGTLGLEAIDNVLSSHEGQAEHAQLKAAFDALEAALNKAERP